MVPVSTAADDSSAGVSDPSVVPVSVAADDSSASVSDPSVVPVSSDADAAISAPLFAIV